MDKRDDEIEMDVSEHTDPEKSDQEPQTEGDQPASSPWAIVAVIGILVIAFFVYWKFFMTQNTQGFQKVFEIAQQGDAGERALDEIADDWNPSYIPMMVDMMALLDHAKKNMENNETQIEILDRVAEFTEKQTGQSFGTDVRAWKTWLWSQYIAPDPNYGHFKGQLLGHIDPSFASVLYKSVPTQIRLDELQLRSRINGVVPLIYPDIIAEDTASGYNDGDIVYGIVINGQARAYPKRILDWHELVRDFVQDVELTIATCPFSESAHAFDCRMDESLTVNLINSGLVYRNSKLLVDEETLSLWSLIDGKPLVGSMVNGSQQLHRLALTETTWSAWKEMHPGSEILSLETGYDLDYAPNSRQLDFADEGGFAFPVPKADDRLDPKTRVLAVGFGSDRVPLAIQLNRGTESVIQLPEPFQSTTLVQSSRLGTRLYATGNHRFTDLDGGTLKDGNGDAWALAESEIRLDSDALARIPSVDINWVSWSSYYPETELVDASGAGTQHELQPQPGKGD